MAFYAEDLAYVHDVGFTGFVSEATGGILELFARHGVHDGPVLDLGCGSGVFAAALVERGYAVTGIDASAAMIGIAARRCPGGTFVHGSFFDHELPRCRAVTAIGECFNYVGQGADHESLPALLGRIHDALEPGGVLVFDMATPGRVGDTPRRVHALGDDWATLVEATETPETGELVRNITTFRARGDAYRRSDEVHRLRLLPPERILTLLATAGFDAERLDAYGTLTFPDGHAAFLATRSG